MAKKSGVLGTVIKWVAIGVAAITVSGFVMNLFRDEGKDEDKKTEEAACAHTFGADGVCTECEAEVIETYKTAITSGKAEAVAYTLGENIAGKVFRVSGPALSELGYSLQMFFYTNLDLFEIEGLNITTSDLSSSILMYNLVNGMPYSYFDYEPYPYQETFDFSFSYLQLSDWREDYAYFYIPEAGTKISTINGVDILIPENLTFESVLVQVNEDAAENFVLEEIVLK